MATINLNGSNLGSQLMDILMCDDISPGSEPSYQICKTIYLLHPMGAKLVEQPVKIAQSQARLLTIPDAPEDVVRDQYVTEWKALKADDYIRGVMYQSRIYGIGAVVYGSADIPTTEPIDPFRLPNLQLYFNILDPLNTAGSLVLNQDPNAPDFQKQTILRVAGQPYHPSRGCVMMNEQPVYIAYTSSAFGFVGRSVYQRALYPMKSFIQSMITDDMVTRKAGLLVAKLKAPGSIINNLMQKAAGIKRALLKEAETDNVISIDIDEDVEALNLINTDTAMTTARKNIIENIATAAGEPAKLLLQESFAEGFGEGTEDAKQVVQRINNLREEMQPLYDFFDNICMHRAWSPEFYATVQARFPDQYGSKPYKQAFYEWKNSFKATWQSLMEEPQSEKDKRAMDKLKAITDMVTSLLPCLDPENKARLIGWLADNVTDMKDCFKIALELDLEAIAEYEPPMPEMGEEPEPKKADSVGRVRAIK